MCSHSSVKLGGWSCVELRGQAHLGKWDCEMWAAAPSVSLATLQPLPTTHIYVPDE